AEPVDVLGMTLADYAVARQAHPQAVRQDYARLMRHGVGLSLPAVTRRDDEGGLIKFCLPAGTQSGQALETESVIIPMNSYRGTSWHTLCLSSQVGCRMGCTFCETGRMGLLRDLTAAEIVRQRVVARQLMMEGLPPTKGHFHYFADGIQNIVFMGMGEPLDNFEAVVQAIRVLNDPAGLNFPHAQITVSTVGRIDGLRKLAALNWPNLRIAISLNAPNDTLREQLMPVNKAMPLAVLQRALLEYPLARKGLFLIEYVMLKDINDALEHADQVAAWCRPLRCVVNLIPYNPQRDAPYATPSDDTIQRFLHRLCSHGIFVKRRVTQGRDLMGACGQLGNPSVRRARHAALRPAHGSADSS
ncbi:MAG: 23S rRNA (adenine(2503)-C(2))-methyltransferase RlmN, partial [Gaiellaceae bacterium]